MLVGERMSKPVITVRPKMPIHDALSLMNKEKIRRLPVVDARGKLVGVVSDQDLLNASPSDATTLSVWEMNYLLSKITIEEIMTREVITVSKDTPLEEAARIMADNKIGGLPVVQDGEVVGIITETDLFKIFLELLGARQPGVRLTVLAPDVPGELAELTGAIRDGGGNIISLGTFLGESTENRLVTIKVEGMQLEDVESAVSPLVERIVDIRDVSPE
jgi:acetoin utilization protein AcuB